MLLKGRGDDVILRRTWGWFGSLESVGWTRLVPVGGISGGGSDPGWLERHGRDARRGVASSGEGGFFIFFLGFFFLYFSNNLPFVNYLQFKVAIDRVNFFKGIMCMFTSAKADYKSRFSPFNGF